VRAAALLAVGLLTGLPGVRAEDAGAGAAPRANVAVLAGVFDFTDDTYRAGELGAQYRGRGRWWVLHPLAGGMATTDGAWHLYAGFGIDIPLGKCPLIRLGFAPGYYHQGGGKPLGQALEFRSSFEIAWRFGDGWRVGLEGYHLSNANLAAHNPGNGSLLLALTIPLGASR
jgi:lipid A 3-O-deacylase